MRILMLTDLTTYLTALTVLAGLASALLLLSHVVFGYLFSEIVPNTRTNGVSIPRH